MSTLDEDVGQATVTLHLDVDDTLRTLARVTSAYGAGVRAALGPGLRAFQFTLLTIGPRLITQAMKQSQYKFIKKSLHTLTASSAPLTR